VLLAEDSHFIRLRFKEPIPTKVNRRKRRVFKQKEAKEPKAETLSDKRVVANRAHRTFQMSWSKAISVRISIFATFALLSTN
jgi:hypothetical protein